MEAVKYIPKDRDTILRNSFIRYQPKLKGGQHVVLEVDALTSERFIEAIGESLYILEEAIKGEKK